MGSMPAESSTPQTTADPDAQSGSSGSSAEAAGNPGPRVRIFYSSAKPEVPPRAPDAPPQTLVAAPVSSQDPPASALSQPVPAEKPPKGPDMRVTFCGVELASPVVAASGTFGYGTEFEELVRFERIGAFVTKGLSREPMAGNPAPRVVEATSGMINAIGLQNMGVRAFVEQRMPRLRQIPGCKVIANIFGFNVEDCLAVIEVLNECDGIHLYELNASCPNTAHGGMVFGTDPKLLGDLVRRTERVATRPLIVKLSPNVTSIAEMARCAEASGAQALSLVNTFLSLAIDPETRRPRIANVTGGLSGPAIKPIAVRMVYEAAQASKLPILGMGGILNAADAVEFLLAGATAVQVGTASYADPRAVENISVGLRKWCIRQGVARVASLTGGMIL